MNGRKKGELGMKLQGIQKKKKQNSRVKLKVAQYEAMAKISQY